LNLALPELILPHTVPSAWLSMLEWLSWPFPGLDSASQMISSTELENKEDRSSKPADLGARPVVSSPDVVLFLFPPPGLNYSVACAQGRGRID
jgi:hypothetical protein